MKNNKMPISLVDCQYVGDAIKFSIGREVFELRSEPSGPPGESHYEIVFSRYSDNEYGKKTTLFSVKYELTPEEYKTAIDSSINDRSVFVHNIDGLMSIRVAKDLFSYLMISLGNTEFNEAMKMECINEWHNYLVYLIHERMDGRPIALTIIK